MADSTLQAIQTKVRRITRNLSTNQLSDADLNQYINTFVLYDFPELLRLFNLKTTFEFFTEAYNDYYNPDLISNPLSPLYNPSSPLFNFNQNYITVHPPVYIAGYQALYLEDRTKFFGIYPKLNQIVEQNAGDGVTTTFTGVVNSQQAYLPPGTTQNICLLKENVLFSSIDSNYNTLAMVDFPINAYQGNLFVPGTAPTSATNLDPLNNINYITGQFTVTFLDSNGNPVAPGGGEPVNSQTVPVQTALPQTLLFYDGTFQVRPVPDQAYSVQVEVFRRPTELLSTGDMPELQEWWQLYAWGAAKKIFEDKMDFESVNTILPAYEEQARLVRRRTIVQQTSQRVATIYSENDSTQGAAGSGWGFGGGQF